MSILTLDSKDPGNPLILTDLPECSIRHSTESPIPSTNDLIDL